MHLDSTFLIGLLGVIGVNLVLAGDNAIVIALAARTLPVHLQRRAIVFGALGAVVLRIALTAGVVALLQIPYLKLVGGLLLLVIAFRLAVEEDAEHDVNPADNLRAAIVTIIGADLVMSIDNVLAVAAAARGSFLLIIIGLAISIPIVMGGATILLRLMRRFPAIVWIGAWLIAYSGIELMITDHAVVESGWLEALPGGEGMLRIGAMLVGVALLGVAYARKTAVASRMKAKLTSQPNSTLQV